MAGWRPAPGVEKVVQPPAPAPIYCDHRRMDKVPHVEWVDVVDEQDRVIGVAERTRVRQENLRHRASYILVLDEAGRVLGIVAVIDLRNQHRYIQFLCRELA